MDIVVSSGPAQPPAPNVAGNNVAEAQPPAQQANLPASPAVEDRGGNDSGGEHGSGDGGRN